MLLGGNPVTDYHPIQGGQQYSLIRMLDVKERGISSSCFRPLDMYLIFYLTFKSEGGKVCQMQAAVLSAPQFSRYK